MYTCLLPPPPLCPPTQSSLPSTDHCFLSPSFPSPKVSPHLHFLDLSHTLTPLASPSPVNTFNPISPLPLFSSKPRAPSSSFYLTLPPPAPKCTTLLSSEARTHTHTHIHPVSSALRPHTLSIQASPTTSVFSPTHPRPKHRPPSPLCLSIYLSVYLHIYISIYLFIYASIHIYLSPCLFFYLSFFSIYLSISINLISSIHVYS